MILVLRPEEYDLLLTILAHNPDAKLLKRVQIALGLARGVAPTELARQLGCHRSTLYRVGRRFERDGVAGLDDRRAFLRGPRVTPEFLAELGVLVDSTPRDSGWERSTWSLELFSLEMERRRYTRVHPSTIARYLDEQQVAFNRARPCLISPDLDKDAKLAAIAKLRDNLGPDELLFYADEVDIHLNPKIGPQWSRKGAQPRVVTPGNNRKAYIAGALEHRTGEMVYAEGTRKNSDLFISLVNGLAEFFPDKVIHVVLDNYIIHKSKKTLAALARLKGRVRLHFLPSYSPDHNPIELVWKELHACVTRNHDAKDIDELMQRVDFFLEHGRNNHALRRSLARAS